MTTVTPLAAMCFPHPRYIPSKHDIVAMPPRGCSTRRASVGPTRTDDLELTELPSGC